MHDATRWSIGSATLGAAAWLAAPWAPVGSPPSFASIEHVFLFLPLVLAPLALLLLSTLLQPERGAAPLPHAAARRLQPFAAALLLASFFIGKGPAAGALAAGWLFMAVLVTIGGVRRVKVRAGAHLSNVSLLAAHIFLTGGAVWLLLSRLGVGPRSFGPLGVFIAALHFHFSGFTLQILISATGRRLHDCPRLGAAHRPLAIGAIVAIPLIALGKVLALQPVKSLGVASVVLSTITLAATTTAFAWTLRPSPARRLLLASSASIAAAMLLAGVYGAGELIGRDWIGIPRMVTSHGLINALGFTLCGLGAHLLLAYPLGAHAPRQGSTEPAAQVAGSRGSPR